VRTVDKVLNIILLSKELGHKLNAVCIRCPREYSGANNNVCSIEIQFNTTEVVHHTVHNRKVAFTTLHHRRRNRNEQEVTLFQIIERQSWRNTFFGNNVLHNHFILCAFKNLCSATDETVTDNTKLHIYNY
jgi:hypothetical protein